MVLSEGQGKDRRDKKQLFRLVEHNFIPKVSKVASEEKYFFSSLTK